MKICGSSVQSFGSLREHSLYDIWNNDEFSHFRSLEWMPSLCRNCRDYAKCLGGCKVEQYENSYSHSRDCLLTSAIEKFYHECETKQMVFLFTRIRRIDDKYLLLGKPNRIVDEDGKQLIQRLIKTKDINQAFADMDPTHRKQSTELLYGLYKDGLIALG